MKTSSTRGHKISNRHDSTKPGDLWGVLCIAKADVVLVTVPQHGASDESRDQVVMPASQCNVCNDESTMVLDHSIRVAFMITSPSSFP